ncbi:MAG: hypothetical protein IJ174_05985 [Clostridia bacterium]|nr:hypothetical protein [Clostridia bacterium]
MSAFDFSWNDGWSEARKQAERQRQRLCYKLKMLEAQIERISPDEFDNLMDEIEKTKQGIHAAGMAVLRETLNDAQK